MRYSLRRRVYVVGGLGAAVLLLVTGLLAMTSLVSAGDLSGMAARADTPTPDSALQAAQNFSGGNADWTPVEREINGRTMVLVPAGCFMMGSTDEQIDTEIAQCEANFGQVHCPSFLADAEIPAHFVCLDESFWIDKTEVTNTGYRACVEAGACTPPDVSRYIANDPTYVEYYDDPAYADHPVMYVNWHQASAYAAWVGCSLPTEAQWEYAARGPDALIYPWGNVFEVDHVKEHGDPANRTVAVGRYPAGASWVGALDMSGNVWEWVADWSSMEYYGSLENGVVNPTGPENGQMRVLRGGAWDNNAEAVWSAARLVSNPNDYLQGQGFRLVCPAEMP